MIVAVPLIERGQPRAHLAAGRGAKAGVKILGAAPVITGQAGVAGDVVGGSEAVVRGLSPARSYRPCRMATEPRLPSARASPERSPLCRNKASACSWQAAACSGRPCRS